MADFSTLPLRVRTALFLGGAVVVLFILTAIYAPLKFLLILAGGAAVVISAIEYVEMAVGRGRISPEKVRKLAPLLIPVAAVIVAREDYLVVFGISLLIGVVLRVALILLSKIMTREMMVHSICEDLMAFLLISAGGASLIAMVSLPGGQWAALWTMIVVFGNDIAAYFGGNKIGGPKLAPQVSPNKTIAGSVCGVIGGVLLGNIFAGFFPGGEFFSLCLCYSALAFLLVGAAQIGDLIKSFIKRGHGVKDTGSILPGHGGMLDRIDGLLGAAPLVFLWLHFG